MLYRYIGYGNTPPEKIVFFGYPFELNGEPVDVEGEALEKVEGHRCFEVVELKQQTPEGQSKKGKKQVTCGN